MPKRKTTSSITAIPKTKLLFFGFDISKTIKSGPWYEKREKKNAKKPNEFTDADQKGFPQFVKGKVALSHDRPEVAFVEDKKGERDGHEGVHDGRQESHPSSGVVQEDDD